MATFENHGNVANQVQTQNVAGSVIHNYNINPTQLPDVAQDRDGTHLDEEIKSFLAFAQIFDRQDTIREPHEATCQWVFEQPEFTQWLSQSCALLWIKGNPGSGKSTLMSHINGHLTRTTTADTKQIHLSYFFNARGHVLEHTPTGMLRSLLSQMFAAMKEIRPPIRERYAERKKALGLHTTIPPWQQRELEDLCLRTILTCSQLAEVFILVDALDEAGENPARYVARYFHSVYRQAKLKGARLRICLSCRHYPIPANIGGLELVVEQHNGDDVKTFLYDNFEFLAQNKECKLHVDTLVRKADGNFQWADLVVPMVEKLWLDGMGWDHILHWVQEVPNELASVYDHIIHNVIDRRNRLHSFLLFMAACVAEQPMTVNEIFAMVDHASLTWRTPAGRYNRIAQTTNRFEILKAKVRTLSGGLLRTRTDFHKINKEEHERTTVEVVHETVNDYLLGGGLTVLEGMSQSHLRFLPSRPADDEQTWLKYRYHALLHRICLRCLLDMDPDVLAGKHLEADTKRNAIAVMEYRVYDLSRTDLPFFQYAAANLLTHATNGARTEFTDLTEYIDQLQDIRPFWIRVICERGVKIWDRIDHSDLDRSLSLLHLAAAFNLQQIVRFHIELGYRTDVYTRGGKTPLHFAVACGHTAMARLLIRHGADIDAMTCFIDTLYEWWLNGLVRPLHEIQRFEPRTDTPIHRPKFNPLSLAILFGRLDIFHLLLSAGAKVLREGPVTLDPLFMSIAFGRLEIFKALMTVPVDVFWYPNQGIDLLLLAVCGGNTEIVKALIDAGLDFEDFKAQTEDEAVGDVSWRGWKSQRHSLSNTGSAFVEAARRGSINTINLLIRYGFDVNTPSHDNRHALVTAMLAHKNQIEMMQTLIAAGADVNARNFGGKTPLHMAVQHYYADHSTEKCDILIEAGADVDARDVDGYTALHSAARSRAADMVQRLVMAGANLDSQDYHAGNTALHLAVCMNCRTVFDTLLESGANVNIRNHVGVSALQTAAKNSMLDMFTRLLEHEAKVNPSCSQDACILQYAIRTRSKHLIKLAVANGADVNAQMEAGDASLLHVAVRSGDAEMIEWLIEADADVNKFDPVNGSVLGTAIICNNVEAIKMLLRAGADPNAPGTRGFPPPLQAAMSQLESLPDANLFIELLLHRGADVNARDDYHEPPLQVAIRADREDLVKLFTEHGADLDFASRRFRSPYQVAMDEANARMTRLLLEAGASADMFRR